MPEKRRKFDKESREGREADTHRVDDVEPGCGLVAKPDAKLDVSEIMSCLDYPIGGVEPARRSHRDRWQPANPVSVSSG